MTTIILTIIGILLAAAAALVVGVLIDTWPLFKACLRKLFASPAAAPPPLPLIVMVVGLLALIIAKACRIYSLFMQRRTLLNLQRLGRHLCNPPQTWAAP
jgi:ABC-type nitrate/sulfonate/bicarbonate transport system permease component